MYTFSIHTAWIPHHAWTSLRLLSFVIFLQIFWPSLPVPDLSRNWGSFTAAVWRWKTREHPLRQVSNSFIIEKFGICSLISRCWDITSTVSRPSVSQQQTFYLKESLMNITWGLLHIIHYEYFSDLRFFHTYTYSLT